MYSKTSYLCSNCGKMHTGYKYKGYLCQSCYKYFRNGGAIHSLPDAGTIEYDDRGYVICHICGMAYKRLGSHIKEKHQLTIKEYKEKFGLCSNCKTTQAEYSFKMRKHAYDNHMPERLIKSGFDTRIKKGENDKRLNKPVRLQECIDKRKRHIKGA